MQLTQGQSHQRYRYYFRLQLKYAQLVLKLCTRKSNPHNWMVLLKNSMRGNQIFSKAKKKALPEQILESRRNNFS